MTPELTFIENILFFLGSPKKAPKESCCYNCKTKVSVIDLGDDDFICEDCWNSVV